MSYSCMAQIFTECLPFAPLSPFTTSIYELCISTAFFARALMHSNVNNIGGGRGGEKKRITLRDFTMITW